MRTHWINGVGLVLAGILFGLFCLYPTCSSLAFPQDEWKRPYQGTGQRWENNNLGISERVPDPWTPVGIEKGTLSCWGREYIFSDGLLFDQVVSQGKKLLEEQPSLSIMINRKEISDRGVIWKTVEKSDAGVTMTATVSVPETATITMKARLEFDGFIRFDLKFSPRKAFSLDQLIVEIPVAAACAKLYSKYLAYDYDKEQLDATSLKTSAGHVTDSNSFPFSATFWIGNHDVGLEWVCDTNADWQPKTVKEVYNVSKKGNGVSFKANIVERAKSISKESVYSFGFYGTPVKRAVPDWRLYLFDASLEQLGKVENIQKHKPYVIIFPWIARESPLRIHGLPDPYNSGSHREKYDAYRRQLSARNVGYLPYTKLYLLSENPEIPQRYWNQWKAGKGKRWPKGSDMAGTEDILVTLDHKSIQDFYIFKICEAIRKHKINGIYIDVSTPLSNRVKDIYGLDRKVIKFEGKVHLSMFAHREYMKRLYAATTELDPNFLIIPHVGKITQLFGAFSHFLISGESLNRVFWEQGGIKRVRVRNGDEDKFGLSDPEKYIPDYFSLPPVVFPEVDYSQAFGYKNVIIPQIEKGNEKFLRKHPEKEIRWSRTLIANTLVYDLLIWAKRIHPDTYFTTVNLIDGFIKLNDAVEHIPWNKASSFFKTQEAQGLAVAAYRQGNKVMVVALNRQEAPRDMTISLPESWFPAGGKLKTAINAETKAPLGFQDRDIKIPIRGKDFTIAFLALD